MWTNWTCFNPDSEKLTNLVGAIWKEFSRCRYAVYLDEVKEECQICGVRLTLAAPEHQEINGHVEVTWRTLRTIAHSLMVHARVPENYIHFALMYTTDRIIPVLPIKDLINEDGDPTTPYKLATGTKPSVSHLRVLFFPCVAR